MPWKEMRTVDQRLQFLCDSTPGCVLDRDQGEGGREGRPSHALTTCQRAICRQYRNSMNGSDSLYGNPKGVFDVCDKWVTGGSVLKQYRLHWIPLFFCFAVSLALAGDAYGQSAPSLLAPYGDRFQTERISRDGFDLYYRSLGAGDAVLLLSGGPGDDCDYLLPVASEVAKYAHAILLEQRGTGRSLPPRIDRSTINLTLSLADMESLREHLNVKRWTVIGHSAGGVLAMDYAAAYPERIDKLILLDSAPVAFEYLTAFEDNMLDRLSPEDRERLAALEKLNVPESRAEMVKLQADGLFFDRKVGDQLAGELSHAWHANVGHLLGPEITAPGYDLRPRLKHFDRPVLILHGRQDPMDPWMAYQTSAAFSHSTLHFINRAGHFPWFDQPKEFNAVLDGFLQSRP
jgi:proline iminopeptidase